MNSKTNKSNKISNGEKYVKCPICKEKINYLLGYAEAKYVVSFNEKIDDLEWVEASDSLDAHTFECPKCGNELFDDEEEAFEFLKNGK